MRRRASLLRSYSSDDHGRTQDVEPRQSFDPILQCRSLELMEHTFSGGWPHHHQVLGNVWYGGRIFLGRLMWRGYISDREKGAKQPWAQAQANKRPKLAASSSDARQDEQWSEPEQWSWNSWNWSQGYEEELSAWVPTWHSCCTRQAQPDQLIFFKLKWWTCQSLLAQAHWPTARLSHCVQAGRTVHYAPAYARSLTQLLPYAQSLLLALFCIGEVSLATRDPPTCQKCGCSGKLVLRAVRHGFTCDIKASLTCQVHAGA